MSNGLLLVRANPVRANPCKVQSGKLFPGGGGGEGVLADFTDGTRNPSLVLQRDHLVSEDSLALMLPECKQVAFWGRDCAAIWGHRLQLGGLAESVPCSQKDSLEDLQRRQSQSPTKLRNVIRNSEACRVLGV